MRDVMALVKGFAVTAAGLRHVPQARRYLLLIERLYNNAARLQLTGAAGVRFITDPLGFAAEISGTSFTVN
jgi:DNA-binding transcriptional LysR family regulator